LPLTTSPSQVKKIESLVNVNFSTPWVPWVQYEPVKIFGFKLNSIPVENSSFLMVEVRELAIVNVTKMTEISATVLPVSPKNIRFHPNMFFIHFSRMVPSVKI
jgi:hypothetical protein